jgi:hypothetical protein
MRETNSPSIAHVGYDISLLEKVQFSNLKAQTFSYNQNVSSTTKTSKIFLI